MKENPAPVNLLDYEDVVVVNDKGIIVYDDQLNWSLYDLNPEDTIGKSVLSLYYNLTAENSTFMQVLKSGIPCFDVKQELITKEKNRIFQISSTFPIMSFDKIIGAIEFSKFLYKTNAENVRKRLPIHNELKKNNTIYDINDIITIDPAMLKIKASIMSVAKTDSAVLIYGSTGTGKELVAQSIHNLSDRCYKPFISINCAAIPATLLESILFGTVRGSYTDAVDRAGIFELAQGGTLFLDEINSMEPGMQVKLLKAIEDRYIRRVGDTKNICTDIRIISAVNENPEMLLSTKKLRTDLYYRIGTVNLNIPPLCKRPADIRALVNYYISFYNEKMDKSISTVSEDVFTTFEKYNWPGNVRELRNVVESWYNNIGEKGIITLDVVSDKTKNYSKIKADFTVDKNSDVDYQNIGLKSSVELFERDLIIEALEKNKGIATYAAKSLKISKQTMQYKMEKYNLTH